MKTPNFFLLGAPKCGTTSIAAWLSKHPDVFVTPQKEPHHFNSDMGHCLTPKLADYEALYRDASREHAVGEASIWYLLSKDAVSNIEAYCDTPPRYIVCLRNPVDMAYSLHEQQVFSGNEDQEDFTVAWGLAEERRNGRALPKHASDSATLVYADACALGSQLERLLSQIKADRVHVVLMDDLKDQPREVFNRLQSFLGVEVDPSIDLTVENSAKVRRSRSLQRVMRILGQIKAASGSKMHFGLLKRLDAWNRKPQVRKKMDAELRVQILAHFEKEIQTVERLLDRPLASWRR